MKKRKLKRALATLLGESAELMDEFQLLRDEFHSLRMELAGLGGVNQTVNAFKSATGHAINRLNELMRKAAELEEDGRSLREKIQSTFDGMSSLNSRMKAFDGLNGRLTWIENTLREIFNRITLSPPIAQQVEQSAFNPKG